jgi:long-chain fatty acid transport protein
MALAVLSAETAYGQSFGVELFNNLMPASAGMAGASIASPQDVQSAIYGNPATMTQFRGTQFALGGAWVEPTYNLSVSEGLPFIGVEPFSDAKSDAQGVTAANIGVTQDLSAQGLPVTIGLGVMSGSGAGADFRHVRAANGTHSSLVALDVVAGAGVDLTDRLSVGASIVMSIATMDGPFVGITGSSADHALRGSLGVNYALTDATAVGVFWKTKAGHTFENLVAFNIPVPNGPPPGTFLDVKADRPEVLGVGLSNHSLMNGRLLLAADAVYQRYTDAAMFGAIFDDQWALQFGAQLAATERVRLRLGYAWNENPMRDELGSRIGGVLPPGGAEHVQYIEALFAAIPQHRITAGVGIGDVLPGVDLDLLAGGMFEASQTFGFTTASVESYWVGAGLTWRFGRGACEAGVCK